MLNKSAAHPILQHDADLKLFLESEAFNVDIKHKEKQATPAAESKGMFGSLGFGGGLTGKFVESDEVSMGFSIRAFCYMANNWLRLVFP